MELEILKETLFWGITCNVIGTVILGVTVISVHSHIIKERRIDRDVLRQMRRERLLGLTAIILIVTGYILEVATLLTLPF